MKALDQTICLCMIVKNEAAVIGRCLASVRPIIDYWVIIDTGSSDATREIAAESLRDVPGELLERPWVNFAHNRNEALERCRGQAAYIFILDADDVVSLPEGFQMPLLTADAYHVQIAYPPYIYYRKQLVRSSLPCRYHGVLHEYLEGDGAHTEALLPGLRIQVHRDGARGRDPKTYARDALILEAALLEEPDNSRYVFYLAQSYRDCGDDELALRYYHRRAEMGDWDEEVWFSLYQIALLKERSHRSWAEIREDYLDAFNFRPHRAAPLYRIGLHYKAKKQHALAHLFFSQAMQIPFPAEDRLFVEQSLYNYLLPLEYAECCYEIGDFETAAAIANQLLESGQLPLEFAGKAARCRRAALIALRPTAEPQNRLSAIIIAGDSGPGLSAALQSVLTQELLPSDVIVIGDGNHFGQFRPEQGSAAPALCFANFSAHIALLDRVRPFVENNGDLNDLVLLLFSPERLYDPHSLSRMASSFDKPECLLVCESDLAHDRVPDCGGTILFRSRLWPDSFNLLHEMPLPQALLRSAGLVAGA